MKDEVMVLVQKLQKTSKGSRVVDLKPGYSVTLTMRDSNFVKTIAVSGYKSLESVYGTIYVQGENFLSGGKPFCIIMRNGALNWFSVDEDEDIARILSNRYAASKITNLRQLKAFLAL